MRRLMAPRHVVAPDGESDDMVLQDALLILGIEVLKQHLPHAKVVATAATLKKIVATLPTKLQVWGPRMGANAPKSAPLPEVLAGNAITLEGQTLEVRGLDDSLPHRSCVWIPSNQSIAGGVNVYAGLHLWTADAQSVQERAD